MEEFIQQHKTVLIVAGVGIVALFALFMGKGKSAATDTTAQADYQLPSGPMYYASSNPVSLGTLTGSQVPGSSTGTTPSAPGQTIITPAPTPPSQVVTPAAPQQTVTTTTIAPMPGVNHSYSPSAGVTVTVPNSAAANAPAPVPVPAIVHTGNTNQPVPNYHGDVSPASMGAHVAAIQQNQAALHPNGSIVSFGSSVPNQSVAGHSYQMITEFVPGIGNIQHPDYNHPLH